MINIIFAGLVAAIVWFIVGAILYMNPIIAKIYKKHSKSAAMKTWKDPKKYMTSMFLVGALIPCLLFAAAYSFIKSALPSTFLQNIFYFGMLLVTIRIIPRFFDMWIQTSYPDRLLAIEMFNGIIGSFVIAVVIVYLL